MTQSEIKKRNEAIAKMLGWFKEDGQPETWFAIIDSAKYVVYSEYKDQFKELPFHKDWNYLMKAKEFIEKEGEISRVTVKIFRKSCVISSLLHGNIGVSEDDCLTSTFIAISSYAINKQ